MSHLTRITQPSRCLKSLGGVLWWCRCRCTNVIFPGQALTSCLITCSLATFATCPPFLHHTFQPLPLKRHNLTTPSDENHIIFSWKTRHEAIHFLVEGIPGSFPRIPSKLLFSPQQLGFIWKVPKPEIPIHSKGYVWLYLIGKLGWTLQEIEPIRLFWHNFDRSTSGAATFASLSLFLKPASLFLSLSLFPLQ